MIKSNKVLFSLLLVSSSSIFSAQKCITFNGQEKNLPSHIMYAALGHPDHLNGVDFFYKKGNVITQISKGCPILEFGNEDHKQFMKEIGQNNYVVREQYKMEKGDQGIYEFVTAVVVGTQDPKVAYKMSVQLSATLMGSIQQSTQEVSEEEKKD